MGGGCYIMKIMFQIVTSCLYAFSYNIYNIEL